MLSLSVVSFLLASWLPSARSAYTYEFTLITTSTTDLVLWYQFREFYQEKSGWYYIGPLSSSGNHSLTMNSDIEISSSEHLYRFYLGAYGLGRSDSVVIESFIYEYESSYDGAVWQPSQAFNWTCHTETSGCCVIYLTNSGDYVYDEDTQDPCNDLYEFESNQKENAPTDAPTTSPTLQTSVPTVQPSSSPTTNGTVGTECICVSVTCDYTYCTSLSIQTCIYIQFHVILE